MATPREYRKYGLALTIELSLAALCKEPVHSTEVTGVEELEETEAGH